jgi:uncharacterized protein (DUF2062 family)
MDGLIAAIFAGVVVAVIGTFAAYYIIGTRRERQKRKAEQSSGT